MRWLQIWSCYDTQQEQVNCQAHTLESIWIQWPGLAVDWQCAWNLRGVLLSSMSILPWSRTQMPFNNISHQKKSQPFGALSRPLKICFQHGRTSLLTHAPNCTQVGFKTASTKSTSIIVHSIKIQLFSVPLVSYSFTSFFLNFVILHRSF